jgi:hypothetical protein
VADDAARAVLAARLGETVLLLLEGRRYQLTVEMFFRLEEIDGDFVYFFRRADALERRMLQLASGTTPRIVAPTNGSGRGQDN